MPARPVFVESGEKARVLVCAFAEVPGPTAIGVRAEQILLAVAGSVDADALSLKGNALTHIQRVGAARMMRVPVSAPGAPGEPTAARNAFSERLAAYKRAIHRQLDNDRYDAVVCLDLFSAAAAVTALGGARLVVDVADIPSQSFSRRWPVHQADLDTKKEWELGERAALKASSSILTPSRAAARQLADRVDPRLVRALPRLVDTRIFQPPTVEIDLGGRAVAFVGGREGGPRATLVIAAMKALATRHPEARLSWIGHAARTSRVVTAAIQHNGLHDLVDLVDVDSTWALQSALCATDIVVVAGDADGSGIPHRALEAMACGRAVVVAGNEAACRDHITPDHHAVVVGADHVDGVVDAVGALLDDDGLRLRLAAAGRKQVQRFDLGARADDLAALLSEGTGVALTAKLPPLEEHTASAPIARAIPVVPASSLSSSSSPPKRTTITSNKSVARAAPVADPLFDLELGDNPAIAALLDAPTIPPPSAPDLPDLLDDDELQSIDDVVDGDATIDSMSLPKAPTAVPLSAARALSSASSNDSGDIWAGDTTFEPRRRLGPSTPAPERVKGAMLNTQSGLTSRPLLVSSPPTIAITNGVAGNDVDIDITGDSANETSIDMRRPTSAPRSVAISDGIDHFDSEDDWAVNSTDTIADASPVEPTRQPSMDRASLATAPPRSFLVEQNIGDMTAEDMKRPGSGSSSKG